MPLQYARDRLPDCVHKVYPLVCSYWNEILYKDSIYWYKISPREQIFITTRFHAETKFHNGAKFHAQNKNIDDTSKRIPYSKQRFILAQYLMLKIKVQTSSARFHAENGSL